VGSLKADLEAWRSRSLAELDVLGLYLDALALRVRSAGKVVSVPVLGVVAIRTDGRKELLALDSAAGSRSARGRGSSMISSRAAWQPR
jgi:putative transposase